MCACVPVAFVLFKGVAEASSKRWNSWKLHRFGSDMPPKISGNASKAQLGLLPVPRGTFRRPLSFGRGPQSPCHEYKSQGSLNVTKEIDVEMRPYPELHYVGVDNMYHSHLYYQGSQKSLMGYHTEARATLTAKTFMEGLE